MATSRQARGTILGLMAVATGATVVRGIRNASSVADAVEPSVFLGGLFATIGLVAVAGPAPKVATGLAFAAAMTSLVIAGPETIATLNPSGLTREERRAINERNRATTFADGSTLPLISED